MAKLNTSLHYGLKSPLTMWNGRIDANFTKGWNNLMTQQYVSPDLVTASNALSPNSYDSFNLSSGISKQIRKINTKLSLEGSWTWSRNTMVQNEMPVKYYGNTFTVKPRFTTSPLGWFELNYNLNLTITATRFRDVKMSYSSQIHDIGIKIFPAEKWEINLNSDITRKEIISDHYKTMSLFDAGAVYKFKSLRLGLQIRNILDCKEFSYTIFNGLDRFSYSYGLRGREVMLSVTFIK